MIHTDSVHHELRKVVLGTSSQRKYGFYNMYYPDESNGKWGFVDNTGKLVIPMEYDYVSDYRGGYSVVLKDGRWGLIDMDGDIVVPIEYDDIIIGNLLNNDNNGLVGVVKNNKMGFFDVNERRVAIPLIFDETNGVHFSEGWAVVNKGKKEIYIDQSGKTISPEEWDTAWDFDNGIAVVSKDGIYFVVDKAFDVLDTIGNVRIIMRSNGVVVAENAKNEWSIISGERKLSNLHYSQIDYCGKAFFRAAIKRKNGKTRNGLIDINGNIVIPIKYEELYSYVGGLVLKRRNKWMFFESTDGNLSPLVSIKCQEADGFYDGLSRVLRKGKFGYINKKGEEIIPCQYEYSRNFQEGKAVVMNNNKWGFIDVRGEALVVNAIHQKGTVTYDDEYQATERDEMFFTDAALSDDYLFALYWNEGNEWGVNSQDNRPEILVFDWKGNFLGGCRLAERIACIEYDAARDVIYGLSRSTETIYTYPNPVKR